jgi:hypothetical protein
MLLLYLKFTDFSCRTGVLKTGSSSFVDIKSRVNTTRELDFDHMIKREHTREI